MIRLFLGAGALALVFTHAEAACTICQHENFAGDCEKIERSEKNLERVPNNHLGNWNDETSSIIVTMGDICRVFEHVDFKGAYRDLKDGQYPNSAAIGLKDNTISSIELRK